MEIRILGNGSSGHVPTGPLPRILGPELTWQEVAAQTGQLPASALPDPGQNPVVRESIFKKIALPLSIGLGAYFLIKG